MSAIPRYRIESFKPEGGRRYEWRAVEESDGIWMKFPDVLPVLAQAERDTALREKLVARVQKWRDHALTNGWAHDVIDEVAALLAGKEYT